MRRVSPGARCGGIQGGFGHQLPQVIRTSEDLEEAQDALCPEYRIVEPDAKAAETYEELYALYRELYFAFGNVNAPAISAGRILPTLRRVAAAARGNA